MTANESLQRRDGAPSWLLLGAEPLRAACEFAGAQLMDKSALPRGDPHPVVLFPGLAADSLTLWPLRALCEGLGYPTVDWGRGINTGPQGDVDTWMGELADEVAALTAAQEAAASLIGWSLGGIYARELAKLHPQWVRCVITLGTPFAGAPQTTNAWRLFRLTSGRDVKAESRRFQLPVAPPVPTTSIFSRSDGIVAWKGSLQKRSKANPDTENIEVIASHLGIGMNPSAMYAVADRLAQPEGAWKPFNRRLLGPLVYPDPNRA